MKRNIFFSRKFFIFNLIAVSVIAGFVLAFTVFGVSSGVTPGEGVRAQEKPSQAAEQSERVGSPQYLQDSFNRVANNVLPSVIELKVTQEVKQPTPQLFGLPWGGQQPDNQQKGEQDNGSDQRQFQRQGLGSGVVVRSKNDTYFALTNAHVVKEADDIRVVTHDRNDYAATLVGKDTRLDLAMVKFEADKEIPVAPLGNSDRLKVGDWVLAMGSPFGFVSSVTAGIVSAKGRAGPGEMISEFIQTDAAINRGNSGGPLVNIEGKVVGISTWIAAPSGGSVGLGFALPINTAQKAINDFIEHGDIQYGWLGVTISDLPEEIAAQLNLKKGNGAFVHNVYLGSPANKAGLRPGDYIVKINGTQVSGHKEVVRMVGNLRAGEDITLTVDRFGKRRQLTATITKRKEEEELRSQINKLWPGMSVAPLTETIRSRLDLDSSVAGVLVAEVQEGTKAYGVGLRRGVILTKINGREIDSLTDFYKAIGDPNTDTFSLTYLRNGEAYTTQLRR